MIAEFAANLSFAAFYLAANPGACAAALFLQLSVGLALLAVAWPASRNAIRCEQLKRRMLSQARSLPADLRASLMPPGLHSLPPVLIVESGPGPLCVIGLTKPVIVLENRLLATLTACELRCALAHEIAHIQRADPVRMLIAPALSGLLAAILICCGTILFSVREEMVPMGLGTGLLGAVLAIIAALGVKDLVQSALSRHAELCCDRAAAIHGRQATASALVKTARLVVGRPNSQPVLGFAENLLAVRVRSLLNPGQNTQRGLIILLVIGTAALAVADIALSPMPSCQACDRLDKLAAHYAARIG